MTDINKDINSKSKRFTKADMGKKDELQVEKEYCEGYGKFYSTILDRELVRMRAFRLTQQMDEMFQYFAEKPKVKTIKVWGHDGKMDYLFKEARQQHNEKLKRALNGAKFFDEEDDLDIEGERLF